ncbi:P2 family phage major capsid protein, partial [Klebsiella pneumoniae]|nr:phage major capsid protein, P2 family [Klebsiella pneumoniae]NGE23215.1 P2 family phage major capsid protein [Klebsiella pneumoniae]
VFVPGIPEDVVLITNLKNLSVYYQKGSLRRSIREEPQYNRVATYQSSNDDYVIEEYGMIAMIDGVTFA